jgi:hypothetical protein
MREIRQDHPGRLGILLLFAPTDQMQAQLVLLDLRFDRAATRIVGVHDLQGWPIQPRVNQEGTTFLAPLGDPAQGQGLSAASVTHSFWHDGHPLVAAHRLPRFLRDRLHDFDGTPTVVVLDQELVIAGQQPVDGLIAAIAPVQAPDQMRTLMWLRAEEALLPLPPSASA